MMARRLVISMCLFLILVIGATKGPNLPHSPGLTNITITSFIAVHFSLETLLSRGNARINTESKFLAVALRNRALNIQYIYISTNAKALTAGKI